MGRKKQRTPEAEENQEPETTPSLEGQVLDLTARCEDLNSRWLRAQADYQNLRRRAQQDLETSLQRNVQPLLEELLFVLDYLDMALASPATNEETKNLVLGVQMTRSRFVQSLENSGVKEIPTDGTFDPALHEATEARAVEDAEPGSILETVRRGFTWQDRVLRHAQVVVAQGDAPVSAEPTSATPADPAVADEPEKTSSPESNS